MYDTKADGSSMENHADREEFQQAIKNGFGESSRYSSTLMEKTLYRAQRLADGSAVVITVAKLVCGDGRCFDGTANRPGVDRGTGVVGAFIQADREVGGRALGKPGSGAPAGKRYL